MWATRRQQRLLAKIARAQAQLHAAIASGDQAGEAEWAQRVTRLLAKRR